MMAVMITADTGETAPWLGRFRDVLPIRARGACHFYAAVDSRTDEPCVVVIGSLAHYAPRIRMAFSEVARVHKLLTHPSIPPVRGQGEHDGVPFLIFGCDAVTSLDAVFRRRAEGAESPISYGAALSLGKQIEEVLHYVHTVEEPNHAAPLALGILAFQNILVGADGKIWITGFGHSLGTDSEEGTVLQAAGVYASPEVLVSNKAKPSSDVYAWTTMMASAPAWVEAPPALIRIEARKPAPEDAILAQHHAMLLRDILVPLPPLRAELALREVASRWFDTWAALGHTSDDAALRALLSDLTARDEPQRSDAIHPRSSADSLEPELLIEMRGSWYTTPSRQTFSVARRGSLRRLLLALAKQRSEQPGVPMPVASLLEAGWPGERPIPEAGANRVYVAVSTLRKMGLRDCIRRRDTGWLLDPRVKLRFIDAA